MCAGRNNISTKSWIPTGVRRSSTFMQLETKETKPKIISKKFFATDVLVEWLTKKKR